jgi:hypothetical protein
MENETTKGARKMSEDKKDFLKNLDNLGFIDQVVDSLRSVGESLQLQGILDDTFYMASKYGLNAILSLASKFTIETNSAITANQGTMLTTIASNPIDVALMTQLAEKKMYFVLKQEYMETPVLKSVFKSFGVIADLDELESGAKIGDLLHLLSGERKVLAIVTDGNDDRSRLVAYYKKLLQLSRESFCPIIPVGIQGSENLSIGNELRIVTGEKIGVEQKIKDDELDAMANDLIEKILYLKQKPGEVD